MKNLFKLPNIIKGLICAFLFVLIITPNNVFASTNIKKVSAINGRVTVTFKYTLTTSHKITDFRVTQTIRKGTSKAITKIVKATKITMNSTKKIVTLTVPVVAETSKVQYVVYKVSYKKDIIVSAPAITVAKVTAVIVNPIDTSVIATVKTANFGATVNATSTQEGATQYQIFDGTSALSAIANLGTDTTIFPAKVVGDTVTIKLLDATGTVIGTANDAVLIAPNN